MPITRVLILASALLVLAAPARAVPTPEQDPFFKVPTGLEKVRNGTVLASRTVTAKGGGIPMPATSYQVKYRTQDTQGTPTATVTTVLVPTLPYTAGGPRPLLSYQTAEDGIAGKCSPSYALTAGTGESTSNSEAETANVLAALQRGWVVSVPDYEGPRSEFLGARGEGRMVLDGVKAARAFKAAHVDSKAPVALWGYSGGSVASAWAAQIKRSHAPRLKLSGIALGGTVADLEATTNGFDQAGLAGDIMMGFAGIDRAYPNQHLTQYLNDKGKALFQAVQADCINDAGARAPGAHYKDYEAQPNTIKLPKVQKLLHRIGPLYERHVPTAPVYEYHAIGDEFAPIDPARKLVAKYCKGGVPVDHVESPAGEHISFAVTGATDAMNYLADRFAGKPAPSTC